MPVLFLLRRTKNRSLILFQGHQFQQGQDRPPGPIDNAHLIDKSGEGRKHLKRKQHYRALNYPTWRFFLSIYGGGPAVARRDTLLTSPPCDAKKAQEDWEKYLAEQIEDQKEVESKL